MSWEFRIFIPIELAAYLWSVLGEILNSSGSGQNLIDTLLEKAPKRTDDYLLLDQVVAAALGLKVRDARRDGKTEGKLRKGVSDYHSSIEKWEKSTASKHTMGTEEWRKDMSSFLSTKGVLPEQAEGEHVPVQITHVVSMAKTRKKLRFQGAIVTVDVLRCSVSEEGDGAPRLRRSERHASTHSTTWLSLSLEGNEANVEAAVQELGVLKVTTALMESGGTCVYGGYPSFAAFLRKEKASSSSSLPLPKPAPKLPTKRQKTGK